MRAEPTLNQRIARFFALLAILISSFFCLVSYIAIEIIETQITDAQLDKIADRLIGQHLSKQTITAPPEIDFFANEALPQALRDIAPGVHEVRLGQRPVEALIRIEGGNRYALVQDVSDFQQTETMFFAALGVGFLSSLLLATVLWRATIRHIIAPVKALADAVGTNAEPSALPSLGASDEIGVLARAFAKRTDELQQALMRERLFTGDVSHELRTPLTIMLGAAEVLVARLADHPQELAVAERVRRVAAEAAERVGALLYLSRAPEQLAQKRVLLNPLIRSEIERCLPLLQGKPVECRFEEKTDVEVDGRVELIGIVVGNLLRNACQHTPQGTIRILLEPGALTIEDTGIGIPESLEGQLFERLVREDFEPGDGAGLGLSIVKRVVEYLHWHIRLERPESGGSRFVLSFPALASSAFI